MLANRPSAPLRAFAVRFAIALGVFSLLVGVSFGYANWFISDRIDNADKTHIDSLAGNKVETTKDGKKHRVFDPAQPANYLIIGSDSREFVDDAAEAQAFGDPTTQGGRRSDTMMVAHVDPNDQDHGYLVSFPRDLYVTLPDGSKGRINSAFNSGPDSVVQTLKQNFGIDIQYYLEVDFQGFKDIVDAIGRVHVYFPTGARDAYTGLDIPFPGCMPLNGEQALAYARSRHYEYHETSDGPWKTDPTSDFGRIRRQQYFIRSLAREVIEKMTRSFWKAPTVIDKALPNVTISDNLGKDELLALVSTFRNVDPGAVEMVTIPATGTYVGSAAVLEVDDAGAAPILERLRTFAPPKTPTGDATPSTSVPDTAPADIAVLVQNGSGMSGVAGQTSTELTTRGFALAGSPTDADRNDYTTTELRYAPEHEGDAIVLKQYLGQVGTLVPVPGMTGADVVLVIGRDFTGTTERGAAPSTTTTVAAATTTTAPPNPGTVVSPFVSTVAPTENGRPWVGCP